MAHRSLESKILTYDLSRDADGDDARAAKDSGESERCRFECVVSLAP